MKRRSSLPRRLSSRRRSNSNENVFSVGESGGCPLTMSTDLQGSLDNLMGVLEKARTLQCKPTPSIVALIRQATIVKDLRETLQAQVRCWIFSWLGYGVTKQNGVIFSRSY